MPKVDLDAARLAAGVRAPTRDEWRAELESGWPGPNGSSFSTDSVFGVKIGATSDTYSRLPADVHDYWYRVLRRLLATCPGFTFAESELLRERVDGQFRAGIVALRGRVADSWSWRRLGAVVRIAASPLVRLRAFVRWRAVRRFGGFVNRPDLHEEKFL